MATLSNYLTTFQPHLTTDDYLTLTAYTVKIFYEFKEQNLTITAMEPIIRTIFDSTKISPNFVVIHLIRMRSSLNIFKRYNCNTRTHLDDILSHYIARASFTTVELLEYTGENPLQNADIMFFNDALVYALLKKGCDPHIILSAKGSDPTISLFDYYYKNMMFSSKIALTNSKIIIDFMLNTDNLNINLIKLPDNDAPIDIKIKLMSLGYKFKPTIYMSNECSICIEKMIEPIILKPCGHALCRDCLIKLQKHTEQISCPVCRTVIIDYEILVDVST